MSDNSRFEQQNTGAEAAKASQNPLDEVGDAGSAARGQSGELNAGLVQRKGGGGAGAGGDLNAVVSSASKDGAGALPHKAKMEQAFGTNFDDVKAHTGGASAKANDALGAKAFTSGADVAFKDASPSPELVAHELTHVVQQRGGAAGLQHKLTLGGTGDSFEQEADQVASTVAVGGKVVAASFSMAPSCRRKGWSTSLSKASQARPMRRAPGLGAKGSGAWSASGGKQKRPAASATARRPLPAVASNA